MLLAEPNNFFCSVGAWLVILCNVMGVVGLAALFGKAKWMEKRLTDSCKKIMKSCWDRVCCSNAKKGHDKREWQGNNPLNAFELEEYPMVFGEKPKLVE